MGKYMRKANVSGEVAVMEVSHQSGVRTRARALAEAAAAASQEASRAYLELRSRRLEKPLLPPCKPSPCPSPGAGASSQKPGTRPGTDSGLLGSVSSTRCSAATAPPVEIAPDSEVSFGENILESDARDRHARETTPCSLIMDPEECTRTPGSTNRPSISRVITRQTQVQHNIPNSHDMEEFFADAEQLQQQIFMERYNFDPVNELPLPGRYEWVKVDF